MSTHDSLIELTDTLIQQNGYQGFSYADLAKTLGIRKASIHYHFQTKPVFWRWKPPCSSYLPGKPA